MLFLNGFMLVSGDIHWQHSPCGSWDPEDGLRIGFHFFTFNKMQRREAIQSTEKAIINNNLSWIVKKDKEWLIDLDALKMSFSDFVELEEIEWFNGIVIVDPEFEYDERDEFERKNHTSSVCFYVTPELSKECIYINTNNKSPKELQESIARSRHDYPINTKTAFIIMSFSDTKTHKEISVELKKVLSKLGIIGLRADDKEYADDLLANIRTYMHCCDFGIAVFERLQTNDFNPNVSLEVGYMMGLGKSICLLKDMTLVSLNADLVGKIYKIFNPQDIVGTLEKELEKWLKDKSLV